MNHSSRILLFSDRDIAFFGSQGHELTITYMDTCTHTYMHICACKTDVSIPIQVTMIPVCLLHLLVLMYERAICFAFCAGVPSY